MAYSDLSNFFFSVKKNACQETQYIDFLLGINSLEKSVSWIFTACRGFIHVNVNGTYSSHYHTEFLLNDPAVCGRGFRGHRSFRRLWALTSCASFRFIIKRTWEGVPAGPGVGEILLFPTLFLPSQSPFLGVCKIKSIIVIPRHRFPLWLILCSV